MEKDDIVKILVNHEKWLDDITSGEKANLQGVDLHEITSLKVILKMANLGEVDLHGANLYYPNMQEADLYKANLQKAKIHDGNLQRVNLKEANLQEAELWDTDLWGANLQHANLCKADFRDSDMREVDLRGADLRYANLRGVDLRGADFQGANIWKADFRGADLRKAKFSEKIVQVGPIGSRRDYTVYFVDRDYIMCGCWDDKNGNTLKSFKERVNETYPDGKYRKEYLSAIAMFEMAKEKE